jgi:hypothetical protein
MASSRPPRLSKGPSPSKAETMLKDNQANGQALSKKQKGFFGAIVGRGKAAGKLPKA